MSTKTQEPTTPTAERLAEWWVLLNCWVWPHDLHHKPSPPGGMTADQEKYAVRGAHTVLDLFVPEQDRDEAWKRYKPILAAEAEVAGETP